jgi:hypothetical protein
MLDSSQRWSHRRHSCLLLFKAQFCFLFRSAHHSSLPGSLAFNMKCLDSLEFGHQRHKSRPLPGPDSLFALFINMIFQRIFWVIIFDFFVNFIFQISLKSIESVWDSIFVQDIWFRDHFLIQFKKESANLYSFFKYIGRNSIYYYYYYYWIYSMDIFLHSSFNKE